MKKFRYFLSVGILATMLLFSAGADAQVIVRTQPVAPGVVLVKTKPMKPGRNFVWVEGRWRYDPFLRRRVWVDGYWMKRRGQNQAVRHRRRCH